MFRVSLEFQDERSDSRASPPKVGIMVFRTIVSVVYLENKDRVAHESHGKPRANVKRGGGVGYNSRSTRPNRDQIHAVRKGVLHRFKGTISLAVTSVESLRLTRPEPDDTNIP